ncbi:MAG: stage III sporulation protein AC [Oscillospiraceae bacterium]|nr:stage III sporulation protein AC [Oscillospiraceae bacterium]MDD7293552.1 stage III sporulation protein AC [Clostridiaceae bacterium]MDY5990959.1 stage III sporulation protein AC [Oscillospiraceae bacterium]
MKIDLIFKIAAIGIIVSILNQILSRAEKSEYATLTTLMGIIIVLLMLIPEIGGLFESVKELIEF